MVLLTEFAAIIAVYAPLMIGLMISGESSARELRPSEHGLEFQNLQPAGGRNYSPEMKSFFNSSPTSTSSDVALPKAMNSSDSSPSSWWGATERGGRGAGGRDHVRDALMVASLVCGITGVILLVASGLLYLFKYRKHKLNESCGDNNNNKLQLVIRNP